MDEMGAPLNTSSVQQSFGLFGDELVVNFD